MIRALVVLALCCATASAQTLVELPKTKARLELPDGWTPMAVDGVVTAYKHTNGSVLVVSRADVPNPDAWKSETKQAYADQIERGIKAGIPGYKRIRKKLVSANGIPALDIEARREGGATVIVRVLLFRTYALSLGIELPKGAAIAEARAIAAAFTPPAQP